MKSTNATNIGVYEYWDYMEGGALVCSTLGPPEYRGICNFNQYVLGFALAAEGAWLLYNARRLTRLTAIILPGSKIMPKQQMARSRAQMLLLKRLTYVFGFEIVCYSVMNIVGGFGTVYGTSTIAGSLSDLAFTLNMTFQLYRTLLQLRGAEAFRKLIQIPTDSDVVENRLRVSYVLDVIQGPGAFPLTLGIWVLLACGILKRPEFYSAYCILISAIGVRSMFKNILDRVHTLVRVDQLQQNAGGNIEARRRRRDILMKKARVLIFQMLGILGANVFLPASGYIFGSINSSTQWLVHSGACSALISAVVFGICITTQKHVSSSCLRQKSLMEQKELNETSLTGDMFNESQKSEMEELPVYTVANESGMSVVFDSEIEFGRKQRASSKSVGLFSDIESDVELYNFKW